MSIHIPTAVAEKTIIPVTWKMLDTLVANCGNDPEKAYEWIKKVFPDWWVSMRVLNILSGLLERPNSEVQATHIFDTILNSQTWIWAGIIKYVDQLYLWQALFPLFWSTTLWWITWKEQFWNEGQRAWRYTTQASGVNAFWLPNDGVDKTAAKLQIAKMRWELPENLIINICNSIDVTDDEGKANEMAYMIEKLFPYTWVFELNFSCPNQKWADAAQKSTDLLRKIIKSAKAANERKAKELWQEPKKLFVKIWPMIIGDENPDDLSPDQIEAIADVCDEEKIDGLLVSNTSKNRTGIPQEQDPGKWWLSWSLLVARSRATIDYLRQIGYASYIVWLGGVGTWRTKEELKENSTVLLKAWADYQQMVTWLLLNPLNIVLVNKNVEEWIESDRNADKVVYS